MRRAAAPEEPTAPADRPPRPRRAGGQSAGGYRVLRVLVCDDDAGTRFLLKRVLMREHGAEVVEAADGRQALGLLRDEAYDLLILDLRMPDLDGIETLQAIRRMPAHAGLPVVVLSGERQADTVQQVIQQGILDFLVKPLHRDSTSERLHAIVYRVAAAKAAPSGGETPDAGTSGTPDGSNG